MADGTRRAASTQTHRARRTEPADIAGQNIHMIEALREERETQLLIREILKALTAGRPIENEH